MRFNSKNIYQKYLQTTANFTWQSEPGIISRLLVITYMFVNPHVITYMFVNPFVNPLYELHNLPHINHHPRLLSPS